MRQSWCRPGHLGVAQNERAGSDVGHSMCGRAGADQAIWVAQNERAGSDVGHSMCGRAGADQAIWVWLKMRELGVT